MSREVVEILKNGGQFGDVMELVAGSRGRKVFEDGDPDAGIWTVGTVMGLINDIPPAVRAGEPHGPRPRSSSPAVWPGWSPRMPGCHLTQTQSARLSAGGHFSLGWLVDEPIHDARALGPGSLLPELRQRRRIAQRCHPPRARRRDTGASKSTLTSALVSSIHMSLNLSVTIKGIFESRFGVWWQFLPASNSPSPAVAPSRRNQTVRSRTPPTRSRTESLCEMTPQSEIRESMSYRPPLALGRHG